MTRADRIAIPIGAAALFGSMSALFYFTGHEWEAGMALGAGGFLVVMLTFAALMPGEG